MDYASSPREQKREQNPSPSPPTSSPTGNQIPSNPPTPRPTTPRPDPNPYPTTFVQADTTNFKHVVQMLTGSTDAFKQTASRQSSQIPPKKAQGFKLYERRNSLKNNTLMINTLGFSPRNNSNYKPPEILSPSLLDFPALTLSPVTPLSAAGNYNNSSSSCSSEEEERVIAEKGFYLHPKSPMSASDSPRLLPLFPLTSPSPRVSDHRQ